VSRSLLEIRSVAAAAAVRRLEAIAGIDPDSACTCFQKHRISGQDSAFLDTNFP